FMADCPDIILIEHHGLRVAVLHGGVSARNRFLWETDPDTVFLEELDLLEGQVGSVDLVLAGHSGLAFERKIGRVRWVNCGTIGLPANRGRAETEFAVLKGGDVTICSLPYDVERAQAGMRAAGLTQGYEQSLITGYWPNEDILPRALRRVPA
ncbi:MAG: metallophosphoesterase, partial [Pseudomonadota bacterium]